MSDVVTIVSLGPGDYELITIKGLNALNKADCIFCPAVVLPDSTTMSRSGDILAALNVDNKKIIMFGVSMDESRIQSSEDYRSITEKIERVYKAGYKVAIVAEGDAGFYSSSFYIGKLLELKGIPLERIAGISAFVACAASRNICISEQKDEVNIITHLLSVEELKTKIEKGITVVLMKPSRFETIIKDSMKIIPENFTFHYFENSGLQEKEFYTDKRNEILSRRFPYFSLLIIQ